MNLLKVANVLDAAAEHFEAEEHAKISAEQNQRQSQIDLLANKYAEATGEDMPENVRQKLAKSDVDVVGLLQQMVEKNASVVESLGGPSSLNDGDREPLTKKEAAVAADDRFLNWISS